MRAAADANQALAAAVKDLFKPFIRMAGQAQMQVQADVDAPDHEDPRTVPSARQRPGLSSCAAHHADLQILVLDMMMRAYQVGAGHRLRTLTGPVQGPHHDRFLRAVHLRLPGLSEQIRKHGTEPPAARMDQLPTFKMIGDFVQRLQDMRTDLVRTEGRVSIPVNGLSNTMAPFLQFMDDGQKRHGMMGDNTYRNVLGLLNMDTDASTWLPWEPDPELAMVEKQVMEAFAASRRQQQPAPAWWQVADSYPGRHQLAPWVTATGRPWTDVARYAVTIHVSEAERLYASGLLAQLIPHDGAYNAICDAMRAQLGPFQPVAHLPGVDPGICHRWLHSWQSLPPGMSWTDQAGKPAADDVMGLLAGPPTRLLPMPPAMGFEDMAQWWLDHASHCAGLPEARMLVEAVYRERDVPGIQTTYDGLHLLAEATLNHLVRPTPVPLAELVLATSLLSKTGFPWLPPSAATRLALHDPAVSTYVLLAALGEIPEETAMQVLTH